MARPAVNESGTVDFTDIQGLLRFGHGHLTDACYLLLRIDDRAAAQRWLQAAPVTPAVKTDPRPGRALQVAFSHAGLDALGVSAEVLDSFAPEFIAGMADGDNRSRRLGDLGPSAPAHWHWGGHPADQAHLLVLLYATAGGLPAWEAALHDADWQAGFTELVRLATQDLGGREPFGFADGISQPQPDWSRELPTGRKLRARYTNRIALGEFVLGYPNEYGRYGDRPLLSPLRDPRAHDLPAAEEQPHYRDLGRNGSYLVLRQLEQDVPAFWQTLDRAAGGDAQERERIASAMVGRRPDGTPLAALQHEWIEGIADDRDSVVRNHFSYDDDPDGRRCPVGAHVRRANPRTGDLPAPTRGLYARALRVLGFKRRSMREDVIASARFHRMLRRGRPYGDLLPAEQALHAEPSGGRHGLHFICLVADMARQFEFVQNAWMASSKFAGLADEADPLIGSRQAPPGCPAGDRFSMPDPRGPARRINDLPPFVTVRGGGYFFLPGIRALRYLAGAPSTDPIEVPPPPIRPGNWLQRTLHAALVRGLHVERRLEPWFRPTLNRWLREPLADCLQYLINRRRPQETLRLAEERILPDEAASLESIIDSFAGHLRRSYRPGTYERGGNTKTHGLVGAEVRIRDDLPAHLRHGIFAEPRSYPAYIRYSGPGPDLPDDIRDVGFVSMAMKLMDVPGPKLMDDEQHTQDLLAVCTPTFVTPNTRENAKLQRWSFRKMPVFYFLNPFDSHLLDFLMQGLWNETQYNPLGTRYWSCVPYLLGEGQAMMYSFAPRSQVITDIPGLPFGHVPRNYLRDNMIDTLARQDVEFDLLVQVQTDPHRMPIENASVRWPEKLSPFVPAATIHIPRQRLNTEAHDRLGRELSLNPWHCLPAHRPLGNQSRARLRMYKLLSELRQRRNQVPHREPDGSELPLGFGDPDA